MTERHPFEELEALFRPGSIAVIGASRSPDAIGHKVLANLVSAGFPGTLYPVNPKAEQIIGRRCYASLSAIPGGVDCAVVAVPAERVAEVADQAIAKGVKALVVISAGFAEVGDKGRALQHALVEKLRAHGIRMVGPNCFGAINTDPKAPMNASFSSIFALPGNIAMASQSGAMGLAILGLARESHVGLSSFVSMGNKADLSSNDFLEYWENDDRTDLILLYLESFGNPARFATIARRVGKKKPIIALTAGRTVGGTRAAGSHTAAMATNETAVTALLRQSGVLRVDKTAQLFQLALGLGLQPLPRGGTVAILSNAGGPAILCVDRLESQGVRVPELSVPLQAELRRGLSSAASTRNPVDLVASAGPKQYEQTIRTVLAAPEVNALIVIHAVIEETVTPSVLEGIKRGLEEGRKGGGAEKPVLVCVMSEHPMPAPLETSLERVPVYRFPEEPADVMSQMLRYARWRGGPSPSYPLFPDFDLGRCRELARGETPAHGKSWMSNDSISACLSAAGLRLVSGRMVRSEEEAGAAAREIGFPVALKLVSQLVTHKTEVGGVVLNVRSEEKAREAFQKIRARVTSEVSEAAFGGVLVQPMVKGGVEVFLGMNRDVTFGPVIGVGLGGIHVEVLSDVSFRVAPLASQDAREMIREIRGHRLLTGYRGSRAVDLSALEEAILRLSRLAEGLPEISSIDLNPVMALAEGYLILDARIELTASDYTLGSVKG